MASLWRSCTPTRRPPTGFAIKVAYGKLDEIRALPGVASAYPAPEFKVAPDMESATTELGGLENSSGYQGEGMVIAILDTGLEISHQSFAAAPTSPTLTETDIEAVLSGKTLNAEQKKTITASQVYHTAKVPFAFDYADNDLDVNPGNARLTTASTYLASRRPTPVW